MKNVGLASGEEDIQETRVTVWEGVLDAIESPCTSHDVGVPGSPARRANDLGRELVRLRLDKGYARGVNDVLDEVEKMDPHTYKYLCSVFNPAHKAK
jgi:hypothetical protein